MTTFKRRSSVASPIFKTRPGEDYLVQEALGKLLLEDSSGALILERSIGPSIWKTRISS